MEYSRAEVVLFTAALVSRGSSGGCSLRRDGNHGIARGFRPDVRSLFATITGHNIRPTTPPNDS